MSGSSWEISREMLDEMEMAAKNKELLAFLSDHFPQEDWAAMTIYWPHQNSQTPLDFASEEADLCALVYLLNKGAKPNDQWDIFGQVDTLRIFLARDMIHDKFVHPDFETNEYVDIVTVLLKNGFVFAANYWNPNCDMRKKSRDVAPWVKRMIRRRSVLRKKLINLLVAKKRKAAKLARYDRFILMEICREAWTLRGEK